MVGLRIEVVHPSPIEAHLIGLRSASRQLGARLTVRSVGRFGGYRYTAPRDVDLIVACFGPWDSRFPRLVSNASCPVLLYTSWPVWDGGRSARLPEQLIMPKKSRSAWTDAFRSGVVLVMGVEEHIAASVRSAFGQDLGAFWSGHVIADDFFSANHDSERPKRLAFAGRAVEEKGLHRALHVVEALDDYELVVAGAFKASDIPMQLRSRVRLLGTLEKSALASEFSDARYFLSPAARTARWEELFGMALAESMASGVVPLSTSHEGPCAILNDSVLSESLFPESRFVELAVRFIRSVDDESASGRWRERSAVAAGRAERYRHALVSERWCEAIRSIVDDSG